MVEYLYKDKKPIAVVWRAPKKTSTQDIILVTGIILGTIFIIGIAAVSSKSLKR